MAWKVAFNLVVNTRVWGQERNCSYVAILCLFQAEKEFSEAFSAKQWTKAAGDTMGGGKEVIQLHLFTHPSYFRGGNLDGKQFPGLERRHSAFQT